MLNFQPPFSLKVLNWWSDWNQTSRPHYSGWILGSNFIIKHQTKYFLFDFYNYKAWIFLFPPLSSPDWELIMIRENLFKWSVVGLVLILFFLEASLIINSEKPRHHYHNTRQQGVFVRGVSYSVNREKRKTRHSNTVLTGEQCDH